MQKELDLVAQAALRMEELRREVSLRRSVHSATEPFDFATAKVAEVKVEARRRMREGLANEIGPENAGCKLMLRTGFIPGSLRLLLFQI